MGEPKLRCMPTLRTSLVRGEVYPDGLSTAHLGRPGISLPQHTRVWMAGAKTAASLAANCNHHSAPQAPRNPQLPAELVAAPPPNLLLLWHFLFKGHHNQPARKSAGAAWASLPSSPHRRPRLSLVPALGSEAASEDTPTPPRLSLHLYSRLLISPTCAPPLLPAPYPPQPLCSDFFKMLT